MEVTGIFRAVPKRVNPKMRVVRSVYKTYVDVIHFRYIQAYEVTLLTLRPIYLYGKEREREIYTYQFTRMYKVHARYPDPHMSSRDAT